MSYQTRVATFADFQAILEAENRFAFTALMQHIKANHDNLWFDYCFGDKRDDSSLICVAHQFISSADPELFKAVMSRVGERNKALEVNNHFSQDKPEWLLQQEFEEQLAYDAHCEANDADAMYYHHFPNECY